MFDSHVFFQSVFVLVHRLTYPARGRSVQGWVSVGIVTSGIGVEGEGPVTHGTLPSTFRVLDYSLETCNKCRNLFFNRQDFYPTTCRQEIKIEERKKNEWREGRNKQHSKSFSLVIIIRFWYNCSTMELNKLSFRWRIVWESGSWMGLQSGQLRHHEAVAYVQTNFARFWI